MAEPRRTLAPVERLDGARFLIVEARYYDHIGAMLLEGARAAFAEAGVNVDVVSVPGALEIPIAMAIALDRANRKDTPYQGA
ncbi:MAG: 6,7-dimethyl-8-ribityllumazine synthase, partial [Beijerinckiaceae bacterium]